MDNQNYSIKEILDMLGISRATLYNRIDKNKKLLDNEISNKNGKKYVTQRGLEILQSNEEATNTDINIDNSLDKLDNSQDNLDNVLDKLDNVQDNLDNTQDNLDNNIIPLLKKLLENKDKQIDELKAAKEKQIQDLHQDKDNLFKEIEAKNKQIEDQNRMLENNQVLLQQIQSKVFLLEQPREDKKGWWKKIFQ